MAQTEVTPLRLLPDDEVYRRVFDAEVSCPLFVLVVFVCRTDYSLQTVVIRLCRNFRDCFGGGLSFRNYEN